MPKPKRRIETVQRRQVFVVLSDRLWEEDLSEWREALDEAGLLPVDVRRVLHETSGELRGAVRIELADPTSPGDVVEAVDAEEVEEAPEEEHVYRAEREVLISPSSGRYGQEPFEIASGDEFAVRGEFPGEQWFVVVVSGEHEGRTGTLKGKEWDRIAADVEDLGHEEEVGVADVAAPDADTDDEDGEEDGEDEESDAADHDTEKGNPYLVRREFPDWPEKAGFKSFFTFDVDEWADQKRDEIQKRKEQQGGGRGF